MTKALSWEGNPNRPEILLVYDKECPVCDAYCQVVRIRESVGYLRVVNARESSAVMKEITDMGLDIDQGMVVKMGGQIYYGSDAIHVLSLISSRVGLFNRSNYWIFKSKRGSQSLYPILRTCRNLLLKFLGKTKINNLKQANNEKF